MWQPVPIAMPKWIQGQSGNPGGRRKRSAEVTELAKKESPSAFKRIIRFSKGKPVTRDGDKPPISEVHKANQYIMDRAYGKPASAETGAVAPSVIVVDTGIRRGLQPATITVPPVNGKADDAE